MTMTMNNEITKEVKECLEDMYEDNLLRRLKQTMNEDLTNNFNEFKAKDLSDNGKCINDLNEEIYMKQIMSCLDKEEYTVMELLHRGYTCKEIAKVMDYKTERYVWDIQCIALCKMKDEVQKGIDMLEKLEKVNRKVGK